MPVPDDPILVSKFKAQTTLPINYDEVGWEISQNELDNVKREFYSMIKFIDKVLNVDIHLNEIENFKAFVSEKLKKYIFTNWRRLSYPAIKKYIDSKYNSCLIEYSYDCPQSKINEILDKFKSIVKTYLRIDVNDYNEYNDYIAKDEH